MEKKLILEIAVSINDEDVSFLQGEGGEVVFIPFGGTVTGEIFNGVVAPGGVDCQRVNLSGVRHMCARYVLRGTDYTGQPCSIFVENNGWFDGPPSPDGFKTVPTFITDSKALSGYLHQNKFVGVGTPREGGVLISMYEVVQ